MFRFIIGYTLIFTVFATIAASSPTVAAPQCQTDTECEAQAAKEQQQMKQQIAQQRCLLIASRQRISRQKSGMTRQDSAAIWTIHVKHCLKGGK
jgi:hypothetical protein